MRIIRTMADRMLSAVVPTVTAAAICCQPDPQVYECYCHNGVLYLKTCTPRCNCTLSCGPCYVSDIGC